MLEVKSTGQCCHTGTRSGQNVIDNDKLTSETEPWLLQNMKRNHGLSIICYGRQYRLITRRTEIVTGQTYPFAAIEAIPARLSTYQGKVTREGRVVLR